MSTTYMYIIMYYGISSNKSMTLYAMAIDRYDLLKYYNITKKHWLQIKINHERNK